MKKNTSKTPVSIVLPVYNEQEGIKRFHARLRKTIDSLPNPIEIIYVNDGSEDGTSDALNEISSQDKRVIVLELSRNFGHQSALTAGMDHATSQIVITMDGDGQHPPEMIPQMLELIEQGYDIIQTQRVDNEQPASFKKWTSALFYKLMNAASGTPVLQGAADFRALSRQAIDALKSMGETHRFLRGMVVWIGFPTVILPYRVGNRIAGASKYSLGKMARLAMDAVFSFSLVPLYIGIGFGLLFIFLASIMIAYLALLWMTGNASSLPPGWSSLMLAILLVGAALTTLLAFIGIYVGYIFQEVKHRPIYIVKNRRTNDGK